MQLTPVSVIYGVQIILIGLTSGFLFWRSRQPGSKVMLLRLAAAVFSITALLLLIIWGDVSLTPPWESYARFWSMPLVALQALPLFALLYHMPEWEPAQRRELQIVLALSSIRLLYELYWGIVRTATLTDTGILINQRPLLADVMLGAALVWLVITIVQRLRRIERHSGQFIAEAVLLGLLLIPVTSALIAFTSGWISLTAMEFVRDIGMLFIMPLMVLVFLDLLPESVTLLVRLLGVSLVVAMITINAAALLLGPLFPDPQTLHRAMLLLTALAAVVTLLTVLGVPLLLKRSVFRPLESVLRGVRQVDEGNLNVNVPVTFEDEIGQLTNSFNRMVAEVRNTVVLLEDRVAARTVELARSEARYRELVEQIDEVIFRFTIPQGRVEYISPSVERMLGYPAAQLLGAPILLSDLLHPDDLGRIAEHSAALARGIIRPQYEYRVIDAAGNERWIQQSNTGISVDGRLIAVEGVCRDVTAQKQAETQLLAQQSELAALQERERIGRDLHDGLGQMMGYVNVQAQTAGALIASGQIEPARAILARMVAVAQDAHTDIRRYILDLRVPPAAADSEAWSLVLRRYVDTFIQNYGITVNLNLPIALPPNLFPLPTGQEVLQIILEALNNVYKHAGVAVAEVTVEVAADQVVVSITDAGVGFAPPTSGETRPESFGLQIMRERAAAINAVLQINSTPGSGTQVVVRVPIPRGANTDMSPESLILPHMRVMLVDDHPLFREGMRNLLAVRGVQVVGIAQDGLEAQDLARQVQPDIILMDMQMPRCNGLEATAAIKAELPATRIIMLTVAADEQYLFQALKAGASGYLLKNLDSTEFFDLLVEAMRGEVVLSQSLAAQTLNIFDPRPAAGIDNSVAPAPPVNPLLRLSARQRDILERVARGETYKEIAAALMISEPTVKYHMGQIVELLQVANRREAIAIARQAPAALP